MLLESGLDRVGRGGEAPGRGMAHLLAFSGCGPTQKSEARKRACGFSSSLAWSSPDRELPEARSSPSALCCR